MLVRKHRVDFVVANAENAAGGRGVTPKVAEEILESPVHVLTAGNHIWEHDTLRPYFETHPILRPYNVDVSLPGHGSGIFMANEGTRVGVVSLQGRIFMDEKGKTASDPFRAMDVLLAEFKARADIVIVDFHAEATSEKRALAWYLDGRVQLLFGTHTHVQTSDEEIMPKGMAYISDVGMSGPHASVIGLDKDVALHRFLAGEKKRFKVAEGDVRIEGILVDIDVKAKRARSIVRIRERCASENDL